MTNKKKRMRVAKAIRRATGANLIVAVKAAKRVMRGDTLVTDDVDLGGDLILSRQTQCGSLACDQGCAVSTILTGNRGSILVRDLLNIHAMGRVGQAANMA